MVYLNEENKAAESVYVDFLSEQIDQHPEGEDKYLKLAEIYRQKGDESAALDLLKKGERENPENIDLLLAMAAIHLKNENVPELAKSLAAIRKLDADHIDFLKLSAGYSLLLRDYTNAIYFANRAMLVNAFDDEIMNLRGRALLINKDSISALHSFEEAYALNNAPKNFSTVFDLAIELRDLESAKKYLDDFGSKHNQLRLCYENGRYFHLANRPDTAIYILNQCLENGNQEPGIYLELAKLYLQDNALDLANDAINTYLEINNKNVEGLVIKARTLEKFNNYQEAISIYKQAIQIDSTSRLALGGLENLERKVAYLQLIKRKENVQRQVEIMKPLNSKDIN
ncbi:MAG: hypothetical protein HC819_10000 [Cyclobacteriaceae bacterium]|nr:hypothetical protein [Cyclobacteriaceae bacterium]